MSEDRKGRILEKLLSIDTITTSDMAILFQVSSRTIRNDIKEINKDLTSIQAEIILKPNIGAHLVMDDQASVLKLLERYQAEMNYTSDQRIEYIITHLLFAKHFVTVTQLTGKLYISDSQFSADLRKANKALLAYKLEIVSKVKQGMILKGLEKDKRRYLLDKITHFMNDQHYYLSAVAKRHLAKGIEKIIHAFDYTMNEDMFDYLVFHILISMYRFEMGFPIESSEAILADIENVKEYQIAKEICAFIQKDFQCTLSSSEITYITLQLLSKKRIQSDAKNDEEIKAMIETIIQVIREKFTIDFSGDEDLKKSLYLHMMPLMNRIRYDLELRNPLISEIKMNYPLTFDLAGEVAVILNQTYGFKLKEDEIAYLSVHFNLALERYKQKIKKFHILMVLSQGTSASELLMYKFMHEFKEYVEKVSVTSPKKIQEMKHEKYDVIISTHSLDETRYEYIHISPFLNEDDCKEIQEYFAYGANDLYLIDCISSKLFFTDIQAESKADAILKICQKLEGIIPEADHLYDSIMERESLLTTELGNKVAFPHPLNPLGSLTFMSVTILDKPILWDNQSVQIIFVSTIAKENQKRLDYFYASFVEIIKDDMKITQLLSKRDFQTLLKFVKG